MVAAGLALTALLALVVRLGARADRRVRVGSALVLVALHLLAFAGRQSFEAPTARNVFGTLAILFLALALGRLLFQLVFDVLIERRRVEPLPRILRDIVQGLLFFLLGLWSLRALGVDASSLLTTSALLTVVAGFALQETIGNLVAGLAIQLDRPFEVGDWIEIHGDATVGRVTEVNWRSTKLYTLDNIAIVVPNGAIAKASLTNFSRPHQSPRRSVFFVAPYDVSPLRVQQAVLSAIADVPGVLTEPQPNVITHDFVERGIHYWLRYHLVDFPRRDTIDGLVRDRIWVALHREGIALPFPTRVVHMEQQSAESRAAQLERAIEGRRKTLSRVEILRSLSEDERLQLARRARSALFGPGEAVVRQGEPGDTMFVVERGELVVRVKGPGGAAEVGRLDAGSFFGELSLLTGAPRAATVVAVGACEILVIDQSAFRDLLASNAEVAKQISDGVAAYQQRLEVANASIASSAPEAVAARSRDLRERILRFFGVGEA